MNNVASFNIVDFVALIAVVTGAVLGFKRGLIGQIIPVLSFIVVALTAGFGYSPCHDWLARVTTWNAVGVGFVTLLLVVFIPLIIVIVVSRRLMKLAELPVLTQLDHAAGALSGLAGGILAVVLVLLIVTEIPGRYRPESFIRGSWTGRRVIAGKEQAIDTVTRKIEDARDVVLWRHRKDKKPQENHGDGSWER